MEEENDNNEELIISTKKNTFESNVKLENDENVLEKNQTNARFSTKDVNNFSNKNEDKPIVEEKNDEQNKETIIDSGQDTSSCNDKTKEIELLLSDPEFMDSIDERIFNNSDRRSTLQKLVAKLGKGSLRRTIFNLLLINISVSSLNLSLQMAYSSIYLYPILLIFIGLLSLWTLNIISNLAHKYKKNSYKGIIKEVLFEKLNLIYIFLLIINNFGNIVLEEIIIYKLFCDIIIKFFENKKELISEIKIKYFILYGISIIILFPLFQILNYEKTGKIIIFEIIILIIIFLILLANYVLLFIYNYSINNILQKFSIDKENFLNTNNEIFNSIAVLFYSFSYHDNFFPSLEKLRIPTKKRIKKIIRRTIIIEIIIDLILAIVGFFSLPFDMIKDLIIFRNIELEKNHILNDSLMTAGRIVYLIYLLFKILKDYQNLRNIILSNIFCYNIKNLGKVVNILCSFFILLSTTFIAINFQYISEYICLIGGSCSVYISFIIPLLMFMKESDYPICHWKNIFTYLIISILLISSVGSLFFTIKKIKLSSHNSAWQNS